MTIRAPVKMGFKYLGPKVHDGRNFRFETRKSSMNSPKYTLDSSSILKMTKTGIQTKGPGSLNEFD